MEAEQRRLLIIAGVIAAGVVAVCVVVTLVVVMLRTGGDEPGTDAHHVHAEPTETAEGAARAAMRQIFTWRPAEQAGPWDALHAAADTLTGPLAEAAAERPASEPLPRQWAAWAASGDVVVGAVELASDPVDPHAPRAEVRLILRQVVQHADGDTTPLPEMAAQVVVVREGHTWKAAQYRLEMTR
ncbi:hypothetical protein [Dietzia sp. IN118]|jgi:hypothetical protein|uniref:hypothetical protein n=1 Tax=Dietzia sp. IN118 TaxID=3061631 RepID=UPI00293AA5D6|nr:hypothetical protein [Dietzia sp. IN118]MDV3357183.1 hypothetical protein [Dietzia sp. IN118]